MAKNKKDKSEELVKDPMKTKYTATEITELLKEEEPDELEKDEIIEEDLEENDVEE